MNISRRLMIFLKITVFVFIIFSLINISPIHAQATAAGEATATVLTGLVVTAVQNLDFGNVLQGVAKNVANADGVNAGVFSIGGEPNSGISCFLSLPEYLATNVAPLAEDLMVIVFDIDDCSIDNTGNLDPASFGAGFLNINPHALPGGITIGVTGITAIFIGGRVIPTVNQQAGVYTGLIILTVAYDGT